MKRRLHRAPREIWVLFDLDNGDGLWQPPAVAPGGKRYLWWFDTRGAAVRYRRARKQAPFAARLSTPVRYRVSR